MDLNDAALRELEQLAEDAAMAMAQGTYRESQEQVPVDTGRLKRSGRVERQQDGSVAIIYGGPGARHAAPVHNQPGVRYRRGKSMYLRDPLMAGKKRLEDAANVYREKLGG